MKKAYNQFVKLLAVIPAFNADSSLEKLIPAVLGFRHDILVVDDGSRDDTPNVAIKYKLELISHPRNRGKGAALKSGFNYAIENGYEAVITLDADGQHNPLDIPRFIESHENTGADLIIGSRAQSKTGMPPDRRLSNFLTSKILSLFLGMKIEDSQCGYRLMTTNLLNQVELKSEQFELESEIIIKAARQGFKIRFIPIKVRYSLNIKSSMNRLADTLRWIIMLLETI